MPPQPPSSSFFHIDLIVRTTTKAMGETTEVQVSTYKPIGTFVGVTHGNSPKIGAEGADSTFHYIALVPNMSNIDIGGTTATQFSLCASR